MGEVALGYFYSRRKFSHFFASTCITLFSFCWNHVGISLKAISSWQRPHFHQHQVELAQKKHENPLRQISFEWWKSYGSRTQEKKNFDGNYGKKPLKVIIQLHTLILLFFFCAKHFGTLCKIHTTQLTHAICKREIRSTIKTPINFLTQFDIKTTITALRSKI